MSDDDAKVYSLPVGPTLYGKMSEAPDLLDKLQTSLDWIAIRSAALDGLTKALAFSRSLDAEMAIGPEVIERLRVDLERRILLCQSWRAGTAPPLVTMPAAAPAKEKP